ncbi:phosphatase PAP2 family protein [Streptomyces sp. NPDC058066]|uniref:phosphatase PAP2 family protein n=1 Tax=Streptomyces sp. NPDC058066 TaxID=3346323 RepID=UPI0036EFE236
MRQTGQIGRLGTTPPVPGRPAFFRWAAVLSALLFLFLTWQIAAGGALRRADERLGDAIGSSRLPKRAAELLADLGSITVALPVLAAVLGYAAWRARRDGVPRWWTRPVAAALTMAAVPLLVIPIKETVARTGPAVMGPGTGFYPSGHATTAAVAYGACLLLLLPYVRGAYVRRELVIGCTVLNAAVGFGLVRRGYHWPLDVVGGWCLSVVLLYVMCAVWAGRAPRG